MTYPGTQFLSMWTSETKDISYMLPKYKGKTDTDTLVQKERRKRKRNTVPSIGRNPARQIPLGFKD